MGMDFHSETNRTMYTTRKADTTWVEAIKNLVPVDNISKAVDIGCGGGIYSKALSDMGIESVTGIDFSESMLEGAKTNCKDYENISFQHGTAYKTNLDSESYDFILERALIHHLHDLESCFLEAFRLLKKDGVYIIQDRTPEDCLLKGNKTHIRGYLFELFPLLIEKEINRRHDSQHVVQTLRETGFKHIEEIKLWETRAVYENKKQLLNDLTSRTGRSILHELDDNELELLVNHIDQVLLLDNNIIEKDRWTIWKAIK
ncbi:Ubiquinone/menaquinone biosynthesis C-methylase UbiE [Gracilibacillus ureilyticus]|uniref:Ubiquinone/menaquinone biosynthesis C-methylase UbiE n=1 Tax=Gracilibacillus ureilyticus TaxID=531814 RepID=A0A1H9W3P2_9BACI|nr:class I SAM-dependent methyltransferase [Gracilibacillus ureilyticus]SES28556.1 Ubiquinone/menaquinone biosynthesis C-methylase UbiE [Gracilibacillus ureilyticus]